ncbi:lipase family alpha/beta hydrolase [Streptomyces cavernicola]|uniref:Alpha/beta fold hydrolase n=1 Tax=Streptomyces cavernicola TaxID=3043613 RepID=A0ABT6SC10_9ACTN|nr:alpha/beta fold hydrolase [Streptomyces sp. B-S-A6]MDI3405495.1 alpha/beta fold hydrolase [Streptomyces sp. B-S-A6]
MRVLPVLMSTLESCLRHPGLLHPDQHLRFSTALLKASALELAILAGHLLLYPTGIRQERPTTPRRPAPTPRTTAETPKTSETAEEADTLKTPVRLPSATADRPVLLLHGFVDNRSVFVLLRRALAREGRQHLASLNYSPLTCDIRGAAERLGRHVEETCERTGQPVVDVVGHSLGGLIARYYVQQLGGDVRVRTLVTLGSPHGGTAAVPLMSAHPIVRQMRPDSDVIQELRQPAPHCRTRFVSFWSDLDTVMHPLETACVDHPDLLAHNVQVTGVGHLALPVHPAVAAGIRQAIDAEEDIAPAGGSTATVA